MSPEHPTYKWWVALTVVPAGLISAIDSTSVGIAIPSMMTDLRADLDHIQWVVTTYLLMQTLLMPMTGWLTALVGRRNLFVASLVLFNFGTVLCSLAWSVESLIVCRIFQALGGGPLQPVSMAILYSAFPPQQRGTAVGLFNMSVAFGLIIGRFGGYLVELFDWRMIFYMTIPFGVLSSVLGWFVIPKTTQQRQWSIDPWGLLTLAGFLIPLLLAFSQGRYEGWDSGYIRSLFVCALLSLVAFVVVELQVKTPVVDLRLYRNTDFALGSVVNLMVTILFTSSSFLINVFLQRVYQYTPIQVGTLMLPQGLLYGCGSMIAGRLSDLADPRMPLLLGLVGFSVVYYWLGSISAEATAVALMTMFCLRSLSYSCVNSPNMLLSLRSLPEDKVGMGTGLFSVARGIAGTLGVAVCASFLEYRRDVHGLFLAEEQGLHELSSQWATEDMQRFFMDDGDGRGTAQVRAAARLNSLLENDATVAAYQDVFLCSALISLFTILPGLLRQSAAKKEPEAEAAPVTAGETSVKARQG
ncbi:MAG: DHA2 family efflux MFS transporter permease subunit [Candidatus Tectimicrobiota bacterium]